MKNHNIISFWIFLNVACDVSRGFGSKEERIHHIPSGEFWNEVVSGGSPLSHSLTLTQEKLPLEDEENKETLKNGLDWSLKIDSKNGDGDDSYDYSDESTNDYEQGNSLEDDYQDNRLSTGDYDYDYDETEKTPSDTERTTREGKHDMGVLRNWRLEDSIPGVPEADYPVYVNVPQTGFSCDRHPDPGFYGDVDARCQVFHICQEDGRHHSFLCPVGTVFNQKYFVCDWWFRFNCTDSPRYFQLNSLLYKTAEKDNHHKRKHSDIERNIKNQMDKMKHLMNGNRAGVTRGRRMFRSNTPETITRPIEIQKDHRLQEKRGKVADKERNKASTRWSNESDMTLGKERLYGKGHVILIRRPQSSNRNYNIIPETTSSDLQKILQTLGATSTTISYTNVTNSYTNSNSSFQTNEDHTFSTFSTELVSQGSVRGNDAPQFLYYTNTTAVGNEESVEPNLYMTTMLDTYVPNTELYTQNINENITTLFSESRHDLAVLSTEAVTAPQINETSVGGSEDSFRLNTEESFTETVPATGTEALTIGMTEPENTRSTIYVHETEMNESTAVTLDAAGNATEKPAIFNSTTTNYIGTISMSNDFPDFPHDNIRESAMTLQNQGKLNGRIRRQRLRMGRMRAPKFNHTLKRKTLSKKRPEWKRMSLFRTKTMRKNEKGILYPEMLPRTLQEVKVRRNYWRNLRRNGGIRNVTWTLPRNKMLRRRMGFSAVKVSDTAMMHNKDQPNRLALSKTSNDTPYFHDTQKIMYVRLARDDVDSEYHDKLNATENNAHKMREGMFPNIQLPAGLSDINVTLEEQKMLEDYQKQNIQHEQLVTNMNDRQMSHVELRDLNKPEGTIEDMSQEDKFQGAKCDLSCIQILRDLLRIAVGLESGTDSFEQRNESVSDFSSSSGASQSDTDDKVNAFYISPIDFNDPPDEKCDGNQEIMVGSINGFSVIIDSGSVTREKTVKLRKCKLPAEQKIHSDDISTALTENRHVDRLQEEKPVEVDGQTENSGQHFQRNTTDGFSMIGREHKEGRQNTEKTFSSMNIPDTSGYHSKSDGPATATTSTGEADSVHENARLIEQILSAISSRSFLWPKGENSSQHHLTISNSDEKLRGNTKEADDSSLPYSSQNMPKMYLDSIDRTLMPPPKTESGNHPFSESGSSRFHSRSREESLSSEFRKVPPQFSSLKSEVMLSKYMESSNKHARNQQRQPPEIDRTNSNARDISFSKDVWPNLALGVEEDSSQLSSDTRVVELDHSLAAAENKLLSSSVVYVTEESTWDSDSESRRNISSGFKSKSMSLDETLSKRHWSSDVISKRQSRLITYVNSERPQKLPDSRKSFRNFVRNDGINTDSGDNKEEWPSDSNSKEDWLSDSRDLNRDWSHPREFKQSWPSDSVANKDWSSESKNLKKDWDSASQIPGRGSVSDSDGPKRDWAMETKKSKDWIHEAKDLKKDWSSDTTKSKMSWLPDSMVPQRDRSSSSGKSKSDWSSVSGGTHQSWPSRDAESKPDWSVDQRTSRHDWGSDSVDSNSDWSSGSRKSNPDWMAGNVGPKYDLLPDSGKPQNDWSRDSGKSKHDWSTDSSMIKPDWSSDATKSKQEWSMNTGKTKQGWPSNSQNPKPDSATDSKVSKQDWPPTSSKSTWDWSSSPTGVQHDWISDSSSQADWMSDSKNSNKDWGSGSGDSQQDDWQQKSWKKRQDWSSDSQSHKRDWSSASKRNTRDWSTDSMESKVDWTADSKDFAQDWSSNDGTLRRDWSSDSPTDNKNWADLQAGKRDWSSDSGTDKRDWPSDSQSDKKDWSSFSRTDTRDWSSDSQARKRDWSSDSQARKRDWSSDSQARKRDWSSDSQARKRDWPPDSQPDKKDWSSSDVARTDKRDWSSDSQTRDRDWSSDLRTDKRDWPTDSQTDKKDWPSVSRTDKRDWPTDSQTDKKDWPSVSRTDKRDWSSDTRTDKTDWPVSRTDKRDWSDSQTQNRDWSSNPDNTKRDWSAGSSGFKQGRVFDSTKSQQDKPDYVKRDWSSRSKDPKKDRRFGSDDSGQQWSSVFENAKPDSTHGPKDFKQDWSSTSKSSSQGKYQDPRKSQQSWSTDSQTFTQKGPTTLQKRWSSVSPDGPQGWRSDSTRTTQQKSHTDSKGAKQGNGFGSHRNTPSQWGTDSKSGSQDWTSNRRGDQDWQTSSDQRNTDSAFNMASRTDRDFASGSPKKEWALDSSDRQSSWSSDSSSKGSPQATLPRSPDQNAWASRDFKKGGEMRSPKQDSGRSDWKGNASRSPTDKIPKGDWKMPTTRNADRNAWKPPSSSDGDTRTPLKGGQRWNDEKTNEKGIRATNKMTLEGDSRSSWDSATADMQTTIRWSMQIGEDGKLANGWIPITGKPRQKLNSSFSDSSPKNLSDHSVGGNKDIGMKVWGPPEMGSLKSDEGILNKLGGDRSISSDESVRVLHWIPSMNRRLPESYRTDSRKLIRRESGEGTEKWSVRFDSESKPTSGWIPILNIRNYHQKRGNESVDSGADVENFKVEKTSLAGIHSNNKGMMNMTSDHSVYYTEEGSNIPKVLDKRLVFTSTISAIKPNTTDPVEETIRINFSRIYSKVTDKLTGQKTFNGKYVPNIVSTTDDRFSFTNSSSETLENPPNVQSKDSDEMPKIFQNQTFRIIPFSSIHPHLEEIIKARAPIHDKNASVSSPVSVPVGVDNIWAGRPYAFKNMDESKTALNSTASGSSNENSDRQDHVQAHYNKSQVAPYSESDTGAVRYANKRETGTPTRTHRDKKTSIETPQIITFHLSDGRFYPRGTIFSAMNDRKTENVKIKGRSAEALNSHTEDAKSWVHEKGMLSGNERSVVQQDQIEQAVIQSTSNGIHVRNERFDKGKSQEAGTPQSFNTKGTETIYRKEVRTNREIASWKHSELHESSTKDTLQNSDWRYFGKKHGSDLYSWPDKVRKISQIKEVGPGSLKNSNRGTETKEVVSAKPKSLKGLEQKSKIFRPNLKITRSLEKNAATEILAQTSTMNFNQAKNPASYKTANMKHILPSNTDVKPKVSTVLARRSNR